MTTCLLPFSDIHHLHRVRVCVYGGVNIFFFLQKRSEDAFKVISKCDLERAEPNTKSDFQH